MYKVYTEENIDEIKELLYNISFYARQLDDEASDYDKDEISKKIRLMTEDMESNLSKSLKCSVSIPCE